MEQVSGYQQVGEFHEVFGHPLRTEPQTNIMNDDPNIIKFRVSLINEEINEMKEAYEKDDFIEVVDAIADTLYVVYGAFHVIGVNCDMHLDQTLVSLYSPRTTSVPIENWKQLIENDMRKLEMDLGLLKLAEFTKSFDEFVKKLFNIVYNCYTISRSLQIDIDKCFAEVHRSNMTKVCTVEERAKDSVQWYVENEPRYKSPSYRKSVNPKYWVIFDADTSKILKSRLFELPNLKMVLGME